MEETENPVESGENQEIRDERGRFKPGFSGNPRGIGAGRPPGKSLKQYERERFYYMTDEEKEAFLSTLPNELRYRMAEGNPAVNGGEDPDGNAKPILVKFIDADDTDTN